MEISQIFGFLKILSESNKLVLRNAKSMAVITALSLISSSILLVIFSCLCPFPIDSMANSILNSDSDDLILIIAAYLIVILALDLAFAFAYITIAHASGIATVLASAGSFSNNELSLRDLYSGFKSKWRSPIRRIIAVRSGKPTRFSWIYVAAQLAVGPMAVLYPNPTTIAAASVLVVSNFVSYLYYSVAPVLAAVIAVVEDACEAAEALEKAEELVQGQRLHGFMVNLFFNLIYVIVCVSFWLIVGDKGSLNLLVYGLFFVNSVSLWTILGSVICTVYYFQCMEYHGRKIQQLGYFQFHYTAVSDDII